MCWRGPTPETTMPPKSLRELLHAAPFRPFEIRTSADRVYLVEHPENAIIHANERSLVVMIRDGGFVIIALQNIASLEPLESTAT
jgi:hypothetical protein